MKRHFPGFIAAVVVTIQPGFVGAQEMPMYNFQTIVRPSGDTSIVRQTLESGAHDNRQTVIASSNGQQPNIVVQSVGGNGTIQTVIQQGGSGNVALQSQQGPHARQAMPQTGDAFAPLSR